MALGDIKANPTPVNLLDDDASVDASDVAVSSRVRPSRQDLSASHSCSRGEDSQQGRS